MEGEVVGLVAEAFDLPAGQVTRKLRLMEDLGVDGDDAARFFELFASRFPSTDLTPLGRHWARHFGSEGWGWSDYRINLAVAGGVGVAILGACGIAAGWVILPGLLLALVAAAIGGVRGRLRGAHLPVTVGDLIVAAETGRWAVDYGAEAEDLRD